jgi:hypothetical protein
MTNSNDQLDRAAALLHGEDRRRSQRVIIRVPVILELTKNGKVLRVSAYTIAVNIHGAMVVCSESVDSETKIEIINDRTRERASARVTRTPRQSVEGYLIPLEFDKPFPMFWQISFPPAGGKQIDI